MIDAANSAVLLLKIAVLAWLALELLAWLSRPPKGRDSDAK